MPNEQPTGKGPEAEKEEEGGAEEKKQKSNLIMRMARGILHATGMVGYPEEIPKDGNEGQEEKKEAAKGFLGLKLGGATLVGVIALALAGVIIGLQQLAGADKTFMKWFHIASGGGKGGGGKKEKA